MIPLSKIRATYLKRYKSKVIFSYGLIPIAVIIGIIIYLVKKDSDDKFEMNDKQIFDYKYGDEYSLFENSNFTSISYFLSNTSLVVNDENLGKKLIEYIEEEVRIKLKLYKNENELNNHSQNIQNMHHLPNFGIQNMRMNPSMNIPLFMNQNMNGMNNINGIQINNHQYNSNQKQFNQNMEEKSYGKYTCKYEILIPNDKEFQVARRLIGSKGCNMKKILNECKANNNINENIKLRLRGRGSGYKEGPQNKESDEPLHLCISAKNQEEMKKACAKVDDLLNKIYEEYKKYCFKNNITPVAPQLANRIDCGNSLHKTK